MKGLTKYIVDEFKKQMPHYYPNLPFFERLKVGDYGRFVDSVFTRIGNISQLGVEYEEFQENMNRNDTISSSGCSMGSVEGNVSIDSESNSLSIRIEFENENSFYCNTVLGSKEWLEIIEIEPQIQRLEHSHKWENDYVIIGSMYLSQNTFLVASQKKQKGTSALLRCNPLVPVAPNEILSANVAVGYKTLEKNNILREVATKGQLGEDVAVYIQMLKLKGRNVIYIGTGQEQNDGILDINDDDDIEYSLEILD